MDNEFMDLSNFIVEVENPLLDYNRYGKARIFP
jgi:hypothetical protein